MYESILLQKVPKYMLEKRNQITMVLFVSLFALVFINVFKPFGSQEWFINERVSDSKYLLWSSILVILGMCVVAVSRVIMYHYSVKKNKRITWLHYILWVFVELVLLSGAFTTISLTTGYGNTALEPLNIYKNAMGNTIFILFIPYLICILYFSYREKTVKLQLMEENIGTKHKSLISFHDERGVLQLSVSKENLIYIESADNYICIWYIKNDLLKKQLLRITMRDVSEQLTDTNIVRCHRSYMANLDQVKIIRREKENLFLELGIPNVKDIPISKTYGEEVLRRLMPTT